MHRVSEQERGLKDSEEGTIREKAINGGLKCKSFVQNMRERNEKIEAKIFNSSSETNFGYRRIKYKTLNLHFLGIPRFIDGTIIFFTFFFTIRC